MIIKADINKFCKFLDSRSKQLSFLETIDEGNVMNDKVTVFTETNLWQIDEKHLFNQTCEKGKFTTDFLNWCDLGPIDLMVSDIKNIHKPLRYKNQDRMNLIFDELQKNGTLESYALPTIKSLIEVRWATILWKMVLFLVLPYFIFLGLFTTYTLTDMVSEKTAYLEGKLDQQGRLSTAIIIFICYLMVVEIAQIVKGGNPVSYLRNPWN
mmetsp:Transcript_29225/g.28289  ORF Transcript_29225/g.28289 Transcript_29225/m.28289 type:complete len:210 (-) Transcript_29225:829-1458(-)